MVETKYRDNTPRKRTLITKGEWPEFAGGKKATAKEKLMFGIILIFIIIILILIIR